MSVVWMRRAGTVLGAACAVALVDPRSLDAPGGAGPNQLAVLQTNSDPATEAPDVMAQGGLGAPLSARPAPSATNSEIPPRRP